MLQQPEKQQVKIGAGGGTRTHTTFYSPGILSPVRLPFRHTGSPNCCRSCADACDDELSSEVHDLNFANGGDGRKPAIREVGFCLRSVFRALPKVFLTRKLRLALKQV